MTVVACYLLPAACCLLYAQTLASGGTGMMPVARTGMTPAAPADREESVAAGREALDRWIWEYPWYDSQTDGLRRVEVSEPWWLQWEWLLDWLVDFLSFNWLRGGRLGSMSWLEWPMWSLVAVLLVVLVYLLIRAWRKHRRPEAEPEAGAEESDTVDDKRRIEALPAPVGRKRTDLIDAARQYYQEGNYAEAIIYLFSHQLVELDKGQLIRLAKGKTNRQYLRELGRRLALQGLFERTMVAFEEVFFGNYAIDRARFESVWLRLGEFEALVAEGAA